MLNECVVFVELYYFRLAVSQVLSEWVRYIQACIDQLAMESTVYEDDTHNEQSSLGFKRCIAIVTCRPTTSC